MKSSRLPKKALLEIVNKSLIERLVERLMLRFSADQIVICTSTNPQDIVLEKVATKLGIRFFAGSELDVMGRFIAASKKNNVSTIARVTGDNPLTDPLQLQEMLNFHCKNNGEYTFTSCLPSGTKAEIIDISALKRIHSEVSDPNSSEYMTYMLNRPDKLRVLEYVIQDASLRRPELSLTVDTPKDISLMREIYKQFHPDEPMLGDIIKWLDENPSKKIIINPRPVQNVHIDGIDCTFQEDKF
jgi:spore coat polysaccharide biosynthesis protein SpsF (cytidylyltransferase family)